MYQKLCRKAENACCDRQGKQAEPSSHSEGVCLRQEPKAHIDIDLRAISSISSNTTNMCVPDENSGGTRKAAHQIEGCLQYCCPILVVAC